VPNAIAALLLHIRDVASGPANPAIS
jgi:hypothetical protein